MELLRLRLARIGGRRFRGGGCLLEDGVGRRVSRRPGDVVPGLAGNHSFGGSTSLRRSRVARGSIRATGRFGLAREDGFEMRACPGGSIRFSSYRGPRRARGARGDDAAHADEERRGTADQGLGPKGSGGVGSLSLHQIERQERTGVGRPGSAGGEHHVPSFGGGKEGRLYLDGR